MMMAILTGENHKILMKEIKDDINRWRDIPCSWVGRSNVVKMTILPNVTYRFNVIPIKLPMAFFTGLEQKISQFIWKHRRSRIAKAVLKKKTGAGGINLPDFILWQSYSHQDSMALARKQKYRPMEQDRKPEKNPCTYGLLIFDKGGKSIQWGKGSLFSTWCWEDWTATCKRMKLEYFLTPYTKTNSK